MRHSRQPPPAPVDSSAHSHQYADVRTTIDLPDELYRTLKTRAAIRGVTMRELVRQLVEQGLAGTGSSLVVTAMQEEQLPVAIPAVGSPIRALTDDEIAEIEMEDERERFGGSA